MDKFEKLSELIYTLNSKQCLSVLGEIYNENGLRGMVDYYLCGSEPTRVEAGEYIKVIEKIKRSS
jgi:hypothetical protein